MADHLMDGRGCTYCHDTEPGFCATRTWHEMKKSFIKVRNKFSKSEGQVTRIFFESYPGNVYHEHCQDLTQYGYPPAMLVPRVEVMLPTGTMELDAFGFSHYFERV